MKPYQGSAPVNTVITLSNIIISMSSEYWFTVGQSDPYVAQTSLTNCHNAGLKFLILLLNLSVILEITYVRFH